MRNLYINRRTLPALLIYSSSCSRARWRNWWNITTSRVRTVDSRSFIYLLSHLSLHAIVLQIYWSRAVTSRTPPMPMHDSFSLPRRGGLNQVNSRNARVYANDVVLKVKRSGKRKWIFPRWRDRGKSERAPRSRPCSIFRARRWWSRRRKSRLTSLLVAMLINLN